MDRPMVFAGSWYPGDPVECGESIRGFRARGKPLSAANGRAVAAVGPHAGWMFSGRSLAVAVDSLVKACGDVDTIVCFGSVHSHAGRQAAAWPEGEWETPLGPFTVDAELCSGALKAAGPALAADPKAHLNEHSIEVQLPFLREAFPKARFLPIAVPPLAPDCGSAVAMAARALGRRAVAFGSTDLTHYGMTHFGWAPAGEGPGAVKWVRDENDRPALAAMEAMDGDAFVRGAIERRNACGPGAVSATISFARALGATRGVLVDYTSSAEAKAGGDSFVSYAGVVFIGGEGGK
jgi:hypothetical protein